MGRSADGYQGPCTVSAAKKLMSAGSPASVSSMPMSNRFSVRVEYSHVDVGEQDHSLGDGLTSEVDLSYDAFKVGASLKAHRRR